MIYSLYCARDFCTSNRSQCSSTIGSSFLVSNQSRDEWANIAAWTRSIIWPYSSHNREYTDNYYTLHSSCSSCTVKIYTVYPRTNWLLIREEESNWRFIVPNGICWTFCRPFVFNEDCSCFCHLVDYGLLCLVPGLLKFGTLAFWIGIGPSSPRSPSTQFTLVATIRQFCWLENSSYFVDG